MAEAEAEAVAEVVAEVVAEAVPPRPCTARVQALSLLERHDISSLRTVFVAGERCDPDTQVAFARALGKPVVDNWWQTETG